MSNSMQNVILVGALILLIFGAIYSAPAEVQVEKKSERAVGSVALVGFRPVTGGKICIVRGQDGQKRKAMPKVCDVVEEGETYDVRVWLTGDIRSVK